MSTVPRITGRLFFTQMSNSSIDNWAKTSLWSPRFVSVSLMMYSCYRCCAPVWSSVTLRTYSQLRCTTVARLNPITERTKYTLFNHSAGLFVNEEKEFQPLIFGGIDKNTRSTNSLCTLQDVLAITGIKKIFLGYRSWCFFFLYMNSSLLWNDKQEINRGLT